MHQLAERFERRTGDAAGRCGDGVWEPRRFTVATFQTLATDLTSDRARALILGARGLVVDEVQVLPAPGNWAVAMAAANAYYRLGISATPLGRMDGRDALAIGALGPVVQKVTIEPLVEAGLVARARIRFVRYEHAQVSGEYNDVYEAAVVLDEGRNELVCRVAGRAPRPTNVFVRIEKHRRTLQKMIEARGLRSEFVFGATATGGRKAALTRLVRGDCDVLVCGKIFNKGVDVPELRGLVNAAAGKSVHDAVQRLGRGGRATEDKKTFDYFDVDDRKNRWLRAHALGRRRAYEALGHAVETDDAVAQLAIDANLYRAAQ